LGIIFNPELSPAGLCGKDPELCLSYLFSTCPEKMRTSS
jgi:hypothetical protein